MKKEIPIINEHIALDLYFQSLRTSKELDAVIINLSSRKECLDLMLQRFQDIYKLEPNQKINTETFIINQNTYQTKKQIKALKRYLKVSQ